MDLFTTGDDVTVDLTQDTLTNHTTGESLVVSDVDLDEESVAACRYSCTNVV